MNKDINLINKPIFNKPSTVEFTNVKTMPLWFVESCSNSIVNPFNNTEINIRLSPVGIYDDEIHHIIKFYDELNIALRNDIANFKVIGKTYENTILKFLETMTIKSYNLNYHRSGFYNGRDIRDYIELQIIPERINYESILH
ncbi:MAG: hypothetical protein ACOC2W_04620 [bacterium]